MGARQSNDHQLQAVDKRVSSFESEQMRFNVQSGQKYSELSSNLTRTQNNVSNVQQAFDQHRRDQNAFNRSAMEGWNRMNSQIADINSQNKEAFSRLGNRIHSIGSEMKEINHQLVKQEYAIEHYAKNQAHIIDSLAKTIHEESRKINELEKRGQLFAHDMAIMGYRTDSLRADLNNFTDQMKNLLSSMQEGMGSFKHNQEKFNQTTIHALEKLEKQINDVQTALYREKKSMRQYISDQREKAKSFKKQLNKQNDLIFWLIAFIIAMIAVLTTTSWFVLNK